MLYNKIVELLSDIGLELSQNGRNYRPFINDAELEVKILKPQVISKLVENGSQDIGFCGYDWIIEQNARVKELLDTQMDKVKIISAIPKEYNFDKLIKRKIRIASEYETIAKKYLEEKQINYEFIKTYGATEVYPPEDADMIIDNTSTGKTIKDNNLKIIQTLMYSSTRFIANIDALKNKWKMQKINNILMLIKSVLEARSRVLIEMNIAQNKLLEIIPYLPCMKSPTISKLYGESGYAVKIAVKRQEVNKLIPILKAKGATDILEYKLEKVVE